VYCTYIASSCISVLSVSPICPLVSASPLGTSSCLPLVFLSRIPHSVSQARIFCHLSYVLSLSLHWICSLCNSIFKEGQCSRHNPPCPSRTGVSQAIARVLVEDGTGEALVVCRNQQVAKALALSSGEWEAVQSHVQRSGSVSIQHGGASVRPGTVEESEDLLVWYLRSMCRSPAVCRSILLTFSLSRKPSKLDQPDSLQLRRFPSGELEFVSRMGNRQNLTCLNIQEVDHETLLWLSNEKIKTSSSFG
uniref:CST complex subunit CTC1 n=1 Tax=Sphenodon punctatus TaxID=8508 RepID=A0A8D0GCP9_SPHPU